MTLQGVLILDMAGILLLVWVLNLVRGGRLYVGYGVVFILATVLTMVALSIQALLRLLTRLVGAVYPTSALTLLAFGFIVLMLVYVLTQLTIVSNRVTLVVQELALQRATEQAGPAPLVPRDGAGTSDRGVTSESVGASNAPFGPAAGTPVNPPRRVEAIVRGGGVDLVRRERRQAGSRYMMTEPGSPWRVADQTILAGWRSRSGSERLPSPRAAAARSRSLLR